MADPHPIAGGPGGGPGTLEPAPGGERDWLRFRDDPAPEEPAVTLDAFLDQSNAGSVRLEAGDDVRLLAPVLDRVRLVEIDFPRFRDGRGFSSARVLREMGYTGEIKAVGDVLVARASPRPTRTRSTPASKAWARARCCASCSPKARSAAWPWSPRSAPRARCCCTS